MVVENMLARTLSLAEEKEKLDAACKRLLANKVILAWIMKHSMAEYREYSIEDIAEKYIEGTPQVATALVHRDEGTGELIEGIGTEDASLNEGTVTYDVRFRAVHPVSNEMVRMIINVEGQNDFYPGYPW